MKKNSFLLVISLLSVLNIYANNGVIDLKSRKDERKNMNNRLEEVEEGSNSRDFLDRGQGKKVLPKGHYVGNIGLYSENYKIMRVVESFCNYIMSKKGTSFIAKDYEFIFNTVYKDILLSDNIEIERWFAGELEADQFLSSIPVEFHLKDSIIYGFIYLENVRGWKIADVQLEKKEKITFDSSSPGIFF